VFAAQNAGSLLMLFTGAQADRLNSKWTITGALALLGIICIYLLKIEPKIYLPKIRENKLTNDETVGN